MCLNLSAIQTLLYKYVCALCIFKGGLRLCSDVEHVQFCHMDNMSGQDTLRFSGSRSSEELPCKRGVS